MDVYDCSPQAKAKIKTFDDPIGLKLVGGNVGKYPWDRMLIGKCFTLPIEGTKESSLRVLVSQQKKFRDKTFIVIKHNDLKIFEVARVA